MKTYVIDEETINQIKEFLEQTPVVSDKFADLKEAYANGAKIQWYSKLTTKWEEIEDPAFHQDIEYRIDPTWQAEQDAKLYEWIIGNKDGAWFKAGAMYTEETIVGLFPKSMGFRHVRGAEFCPPKDEQ